MGLWPGEKHVHSRTVRIFSDLINPQPTHATDNVLTHFGHEISYKPCNVILVTNILGDLPDLFFEMYLVLGCLRLTGYSPRAHRQHLFAVSCKRGLQPLLPFRV